MSITRSRPVPQANGSVTTSHDPSHHFGSLPSSGPFSAQASSAFPGSSSPAALSSLGSSRPRRPSSSSTATRLSARRVSSSSATPTLGSSAPKSQQARARSSSRSRTRMSGAGQYGSSYEKESKFDRLFGSSSNGMNRGRSSNGHAVHGNTSIEQEDHSLDADLELEEQEGEADEDDTYGGAAPGKRRTSNGVAPKSKRENSVPAAAAGGAKGKKEILRCERCHKVYHHPQSLIKHRWQHTDQWNSASSYGLSKHQTVQALEAAVILSNPDGLSLLPEDKSHWPAAVSPATSGLLGSERLNIDVLRNTGYSQSVPNSMYRGERADRFGTSLGSMLEEEEAKEKEDEDSTDSEDDFGIYAEKRDDNAEQERGMREDTEMERMDEEMFSLDLASQHGTPAGQHAQLPDGRPPGSSGLLAYTRSQYAQPSATSSMHPTQSVLRASSHSRRSQREQSAASGSTEHSTGSTNSETTHSNETGETGFSAQPAHASSPHHLTVHNHHSTGLPNLSVSAPVLGFFTEQNPPQATVVSPHLGPTVMTSPQLRATTAHPSLVPIPVRQQEVHSGYTPEETALAEALSSSYNSNRSSSFKQTSSVISPRLHGIPLIPQHGRTMSNGRISTGLSSSPYARSPYAGSVAVPSSSNGLPSGGAGYSTSFGQAPLATSYRSSGAGVSTPSPLVRPVDFNDEENAEANANDEEIMDMDL